MKQFTAQEIVNLRNQAWDSRSMPINQMPKRFRDGYKAMAELINAEIVRVHDEENKEQPAQENEENAK